MVRALGARYHSDPLSSLDLSPDIVIECTGSLQLVVDILARTARNSIVCLAGVSSGARVVQLAASQFNNTMVLENDVVFGSLNANRRHYELAARALQKADRAWLATLISRKVPLGRFPEAFEKRTRDIKVVLDMRA